MFTINILDQFYPWSITRCVKPFHTCNIHVPFAPSSPASFSLGIDLENNKKNEKTILKANPIFVENSVHDDIVC